MITGNYLKIRKMNFWECLFVDKCLLEPVRLSVLKTGLTFSKIDRHFGKKMFFFYFRIYFQEAFFNFWRVSFVMLLFRILWLAILFLANSFLDTFLTGIRCMASIYFPRHIIFIWYRRNCLTVSSLYWPLGIKSSYPWMNIITGGGDSDSLPFSTIRLYRHHFGRPYRHHPL